MKLERRNTAAQQQIISHFEKCPYFLHSLSGFKCMPFSQMQKANSVHRLKLDILHKGLWYGFGVHTESVGSFSM